MSIKISIECSMSCFKDSSVRSKEDLIELYGKMIAKAKEVLGGSWYVGSGNCLKRNINKLSECHQEHYYIDIAETDNMASLSTLLDNRNKVLVTFLALLSGGKQIMIAHFHLHKKEGGVILYLTVGRDGSLYITPTEQLHASVIKVVDNPSI